MLGGLGGTYPTILVAVLSHLFATLGIYLFGTWHSIFFFPALISIVLAVVTFFLLKDTPQSCGLPPIEEYKHETVATEVKDENKTTFKEIFYKYILHNKYLWYLAIANIFVYFIRYGVVSWAPTYLTAVKGFYKRRFPLGLLLIRMGWYSRHARKWLI